MGVLCDLAAKHGLGKWELNDTFLGEDNYLPHDVAEWAKLDEHDPTAVQAWSMTDTLAGMNDRGWSFASIADVIEEQL